LVHHLAKSETRSRHRYCRCGCKG